MMNDQTDELPMADQFRICQQFTLRVNRRAEEDMLSGNPVTGAHHRALLAELTFMEWCLNNPPLEVEMTI